MARTRLREHRRLERRNADQSEVVGCRFLTSRRSIIFALVLALSPSRSRWWRRERRGGEGRVEREGRDDGARRTGSGGKSKEHLCQLGRNRATDGWAKQVGRHAGILRFVLSWAQRRSSLIHRSSARRHNFFSPLLSLSLSPVLSLYRSFLSFLSFSFFCKLFFLTNFAFGYRDEKLISDISFFSLFGIFTLRGRFCLLSLNASRKLK